MSNRFRPSQRLHAPREYAAVFAARQVIRSTCFDLLRGTLKGTDSDRANHANPCAIQFALPLLALRPRLGLVIPKRLARRAVLRNTIKRQAREVFRLHEETLPAVDIVLRLARWPTEMATLVVTPMLLKRALRLEVELLLEKLKRRVVTQSVGSF